MFACKLIGDAYPVGPALAGKAACMATQTQWLYRSLTG